MAWRSSGTSNDDLVNNLKRFGVIQSDPVEEAFRAVDRCHFVPQNLRNLAHADQPLQAGHVHISAPHIYGCIVEALDVKPNSSMSFLNIGSGTGYLSCIVARILGRSGLCYGVDIREKAIEHCMLSLDRYKAASQEKDSLPHMEFIHGNGLHVDAGKGEALVGFDRIYVGASIERSHLSQLAGLLRHGGILVAPVEDELVKIVRVRNTTAGAVSKPSVPRSLRGRPPALSNDFAQEVISAVRFTEVVRRPNTPTLLHSRVWNPSLHRQYPDSFRVSCKEILLCARAPKYQPPPEVVPQMLVNVASKLPKAIWLNILSYTHRDWFDRSCPKDEVLRRRLEEEQQATKRAEEARLDAEARLVTAEREREGYRLLALHFQSRLQRVMNDRSGAAREASDGDGADLLVDIDMLHTAGSGLGGLNEIIRQFQSQEGDSDEDSSVASDPGQVGMDDDSDFDDDSSNSSMEDSEESATSDRSVIAASPTISATAQVGRPTRAVSITSHDIHR